MKCANCSRNVRDENAVGKYGPTCAKRLGIVAAKPVRQKQDRPKKERKRQAKRDVLTVDLFEGM